MTAFGGYFTKNDAAEGVGTLYNAVTKFFQLRSTANLGFKTISQLCVK